MAKGGGKMTGKSKGYSKTGAKGVGTTKKNRGGNVETDTSGKRPKNPRVKYYGGGR